MSLFSNPTDVILRSLFIADWESGVEVASTWDTDVSTTQTQDESRRGLVDRPYRTMKVTLKAIESRAADSQLLMELIRKNASGWVTLPLYPDFVKLTSSSIVGATSIVVSSTIRRRFAVGMKVLIVNLSGSHTKWVYETATVSAVSATGLSFSSGLTLAWAAGSRIYPAFRTEVSLESLSELITRGSASDTFQALEVAGKAAIPACATLGSNPTGFEVWNSLPVFEAPIVWDSTVQVGAVRAGSLDRVGLAVAAELYGSMPKFKFTGTISGLTREAAWPILQFFDSRGGRLFPFWMESPAVALKIRSISGTQIICDGSPTLEDAQAHIGKHIQILSNGGIKRRYRVASVTSSGSLVTLTMTASVVETVSSIIRASWFYLCRFDTDTLNERWQTDEGMQGYLSAIELNLNSSGTGENVPETPTIDPLGSGSEPGDPWDADKFCKTAAGVSVPMFTVACDGCDPDRPLFRMADFSLPKRIKLEIDGFEKDTAHSHSGALTKLLKNLQGKFVCEYDSGMSFVGSTRSRHWHHLRIQGATITWVNDPPLVLRYGFRKTKVYEGEDGGSYTIEVRVIYEIPSEDKGCFGPMTHIYAFSNEVNPSFIEGGTVGGISFYRSDPAVYSGSTKKCHPQMVYCACIPTYMESPCGHDWVDPHYDDGTEETVECEALGPGIPWLSGSPLTERAIDNSVFGHTLSAYKLATITLGGGNPSYLFPWVCIENVAGLTAFKPILPGWDTTKGGLLLEAGSDITIFDCVPDQVLLADECVGHASTKNKGTPGCWGTKGITGWTGRECCFDTEKPGILILTQMCVAVTDCFDGDGNPKKPVISYTPLTRVYEAYPYKCDYADDVDVADQLGRQFEWRAYADTPGASIENYRNSFSGTGVDTATISDWLGTNYITGGFLTAATVGSSANGPAFSMAINDYGNYHNVQVMVRVNDSSFKSGLFLRAGLSAGKVSGYYAEVDPAVSTIRIYSLTAGIRTLLAEKVYTIPMADRDVIVFKAAKKTLSFGIFKGLSYNPATGYSKKNLKFTGPQCLTVIDCDWTDGFVGVCSDESSPSQIFDDLEAIDQSLGTTYSSVTYGVGGWSVSAPAGMFKGFAGYCDGTETNPGCTTNCCTTARTLNPPSIDADETDVGFVSPPGPPKWEPCTLSENGLPQFVAVEFRPAMTCGLGSTDTNCEGFQIWKRDCAVEP